MSQKFENYLMEFEKNVDKEINEIIVQLKNQLNQANAYGYVLGMSGGIDCSVMAALCQKGNIPCYLVSLPYGESMKGNAMNDALLVANTFGLPIISVDITSIVDMVYANTCCIENHLDTLPQGNKDMAFANIAPRIRMTQLYAVAQAHNLLVLGTSNLSEIVMGYFTKWGDGAADVEPISHLTKSEVRIMARRLGVPERIIQKAPSADLWEGQTDENEMGISYDALDRYILFKEGTDDVIKKVEETMKRVSHKIGTLSIGKNNPKPWVTKG